MYLIELDLSTVKPFLIELQERNYRRVRGLHIEPVVREQVLLALKDVSAVLRGETDWEPHYAADAAWEAAEAADAAAKSVEPGGFAKDIARATEAAASAAYAAYWSISALDVDIDITQAVLDAVCETIASATLAEPDWAATTVAEEEKKQLVAYAQGLSL